MIVQKGILPNKDITLTLIRRALTTWIEGQFPFSVNGHHRTILLL